MKITFSKYVIATVLFVSTSVSITAQSTTSIASELDALTHQMFVDMNNKNYDAILEKTHPKVFEMVSKETMSTVIKSMFEGNEQFSIEIPKEIPEYKVSQVFKGSENNLEYAFASYDMKMNMTFKDQTFDETGKETMKSMMSAQGMVVDFISDNTIKVIIKNSMTIILREDTTNNEWVMINYDADSPLFYQILSKEVLEKSKSYKQDLMLASKDK